MLRVGRRVEAHTNQMVELTKMDGTWVWLGTAVREVEMCSNFAHDELLEVDLLVNPLNRHCNVLMRVVTEFELRMPMHGWLSQ